MAQAGVGTIWCHTCGIYIRPGTHGIHHMPYGQGPQGTYAEEETISSFRAILYVVAGLTGLGIVALVAVMLAMR